MTHAHLAVLFRGVRSEGEGRLERGFCPEAPYILRKIRTALAASAAVSSAR